MIASIPQEYIIPLLVLLVIPILPNLWSIYHAFYRDFPSSAEKMAWLGVCIFIPVLGGLGYLFWGGKRGEKPR
jgi:hypothetical protein